MMAGLKSRNHGAYAGSSSLTLTLVYHGSALIELRLGEGSEGASFDASCTPTLGPLKPLPVREAGTDTSWKAGRETTGCQTTHYTQTVVPGEAAAVICTCFASISSQSIGLCLAPAHAHRYVTEGRQSRPLKHTRDLLCFTTYIRLRFLCPCR